MRGSRKAALAAAAVLLLGLAGCGDGDLSVPSPATDEAAEVAKELARAAEAQGVCYGWELNDSSDPAPVSRGSNLGASTPVDSDPTRCARWVEVAARVTYFAESSESEDYATLDVRTSDGLTVGSAIEADLDRLGLDEKAFVDDPSWAIARAALALPLLTAEAGGAEPAPTPSAAPTTAPRALPDAGSDFWRDRLGMMIAALALLAVAGIFVLVGVFAGRRQKARAATRPR